MTNDQVTKDNVREQVRAGYSAIAKKGVFTTVQEEVSSCCSGGGCCGPTNFDVNELVKKIGYTEGELTATPESANMGLSCGNPTAIASLTPGELVLDLGSGGGFDVFIAGPKVGATGRVIGVDMTPDMISKARRNAVVYSERTGLDNVEFRLGEIEHLPAADGSVDVVISNCVLNLSPDKPQVWREIFRVLKPGGRAAISDLALLKPLPAGVFEMVEALVGCVSGAALVSDIEKMVKDAGFMAPRLTTKSDYFEALGNWEDPLYKKIHAALPKGAKVDEYVTNLDIQVTKS